MHEMTIYAIPTLLLVAFVILILTGDRKEKRDEGNEGLKGPKGSRAGLDVRENMPPGSIDPTEFDVGLIHKPTPKSSSLCNDTVLKPIIPVNVDYGWKMPANCPCTKYLEPP
jgi:hypothetical protein